MKQLSLCLHEFYRKRRIENFAGVPIPLNNVVKNQTLEIILYLSQITSYRFVMFDKVVLLINLYKNSLETPKQPHSPCQCVCFTKFPPVESVCV